ncbi:hypothetical protein [Streptomyces niger]|uniref:hypothetical protein n=1 Tax=Streptomyces niger TaxID=66373 RepID=UPI00069B5ADB|nr:hypothetical protein [Streptomyces niger]
MFVVSRYFLWVTGRLTTSVTLRLDPGRRYLLTGGLTGKYGAEYGQVFISTVCVRRGSDQVLCGVRDDPADSPADNIRRLNIDEFLENATRVTVKLRSDGGGHRAEGILYDIT